MSIEIYSMEATNKYATLCSSMGAIILMRRAGKMSANNTACASMMGVVK